MWRITIFPGLLLWSAIGLAQDSSFAALKTEQLRIDSITKSIDSNIHLKAIAVNGASRRDVYTAMSYQQPKTLELRKMAITFKVSGQEETIYTSGNKILKVVNDSGEYYSLNNFYYNKHLQKTSSPTLLDSLKDSESIISIAINILSRINSKRR